MKEGIRKTVEELGQRLTDKGRDILIFQEKNVEHVLGQLQQPTQEHEASAPHATPNELERQSGYDKLYHPRPERREKSEHPYRPPPLHRNRDDRHLAGERSRQYPNRHRTFAPHAPAKESERQQKSEYDSVYDTPPANQTHKPEHHDQRPLRGSGQKTDFDRLYDKPDGRNDEHGEPERNPDGPERKM